MSSAFTSGNPQQLSTASLPLGCEMSRKNKGEKRQWNGRQREQKKERERGGEREREKKKTKKKEEEDEEEREAVTCDRTVV